MYKNSIKSMHTHQLENKSVGLMELVLLTIQFSPELDLGWYKTIKWSNVHGKKYSAHKSFASFIIR